MFTLDAQVNVVTGEVERIGDLRHISNELLEQSDAVYVRIEPREAVDLKRILLRIEGLEKKRHHHTEQLIKSNEKIHELEDVLKGMIR